MRKKALLSSIILSLAIGCGGGNLLEGVADDNSQEACRVETSTALDEGRYDDVINSPCADDLQKAAAYLGKAGFDPADVANRLIEGKDEDNTADFYLKTLVGEVDDRTLNYINKAYEHYEKVINSNKYPQNIVEDAKFNKAITATLKGLVVAKLTIVSSISVSAGSPEEAVRKAFECDLNNNGKPDEVDATACALEYVANGSCTVNGVSYTVNRNLTLKRENGEPINNTFTGFVVNINVNVLNPNPDCPTKYKKLLDANETKVITTAPNTCYDQYGESWPCPVIVDDQPADLVETISDTLNDAEQTIEEVLAETNPDIKESVKDLKEEVCGSDGVCTPEEVKSYLEKIQAE